MGGRIAFDQDDAYLEMDEHHFKAGLKRDGVVVFEVDSSDVNVDGLPQAPLWKEFVQDAAKRPERFTTLEVMEQVVDPEADSTKQYITTLIATKILDSYLTWTQSIREAKRSLRISKGNLMLAGYVSLEMAESCEFMDELADAADLPGGDDE